MCKFVSAVATKDRLYFGTTDSHSKIIDQHGLHESGAHGVNIVKLELIPDKPSDPIRNWSFVVDQDVLPDWWNAEKCEERMRNAVRRSGVRKALAEYEKVCDTALAEYEKVHEPALAEYVAKRTKIRERVW